MSEGIVDVLYIVSTVGASMSTIVAGFVVYIYSTSSRFKSFSCRLTRLLCITDVFLSISFILPSPYEGFLCTAQSLLITYFLLSSILWTAAISHAAYTVTSSVEWDEDLLMKRYLVAAYGTPIIAFTILFVTNGYGKAEGWCWIQAKDFWSVSICLVCFYAPLILVIAFNIVTYKKILRELDDQESTQQLSKRLKFYPWILIITQVTMAIHRFISIVFNDYVFALAIVGVLLTTLMGLINALLYGFNDTLIEHTMNWCRTNDHIGTSMDSFDDSVIHQSLNR